MNKAEFPSGYDYFFLPRRKLSVEFEGMNFESTSKKIKDVVKKVNETTRSA